MFLLFTPLNSQLEKAREATDAANLRAKYAEVVSAQLTGETVKDNTVKLTQKQAGWQDATIKAGKIGDKAANTIIGDNDATDGKTVTVTYDETNGVTFTLSK